MAQFRKIEKYWIDENWLGKRMLFVSGPRQCGKTTLVRDRLCPDSDSYFNWDDRKVRKMYIEDAGFFSFSMAKWLCFDEIHKRPNWKDILKGIYDVYNGNYRFIITGSARLDTFKKSGDSLLGRYFHTHLFPLNLGDFNKHDFILPKSANELIDMAQDEQDAKGMEDLLKLGGFPEPFFSGSETFWKRWSSNHHDLIISEDIRDLTRIVELDKMELLLKFLGKSIGNVMGYSSLARDLETDHQSIKRWLNQLNKVQLVFKVPPYSKNIRRSYILEQKWYYHDWRAAPVNTFENYVACSLHRATTLYNDRFGENFDLNFIRTRDGAEVDFLITRDEIPWLLVEAKEGHPDATHATYRFARELNVPCVITTARPGIAAKKMRQKDQNIVFLSWSKLGKILP